MATPDDDELQATREHLAEMMRLPAQRVRLYPPDLADAPQEDRDAYDEGYVAGFGGTSDGRRCQVDEQYRRGAVMGTHDRHSGRQRLDPHW